MRRITNIGLWSATVLAVSVAGVPSSAQTSYEWNNVQIVGGGYIPAIVYSRAAVDTVDPHADLVYARTDIGGAYRRDSTTPDVWVPLLDWVGWEQWGWTGVVSVAPDPVMPERVYLAVGGYTIWWDPNPGAILRSDDYGATWDQQVELPFKLGGNMPGRSMGERLVVDPNNNDVLYLGAPSGNGLWRSLDAGLTWHEVDAFRTAACGANPVAGCPGSYVQDPGFEYTNDPVGVVWVTIDPMSAPELNVVFDEDPLTTVGQVSGTLYVGLAEIGQNQPNVYYSTDGGQSFAPVPGQPTDGFMPHHGELAHVAGTTYLYVPYSNKAGPYDGDMGDVWRYDTVTEAWEPISPVPSTDPDGNNYFGYGGVTVDATHPNTLMVSTLNSWWPDTIFWRSTDDGLTWTKVWDWTRYPKRSFRYVQDISAAPWLDLGVPGGPGRPSAEVSPKLGWMTGVLAINPNDSDQFLYGTGATLYGSDNLTLWDSNQQIDIEVMAKGIEETAVLALVSPPLGAPLVSGLGDIAGFRHDDLGVVPQQTFQNPHWSTTTDLDFAELSPSYMFRVGNPTDDDGIKSGAYSMDGGATWSPVQNQPAGITGGGSVAVSADASSVVWSPGGTGVFFTTNDGLAWNPSQGIPAGARVAADRVNPNVIYGYTGDTGQGLDDGTLWVSFNGGAQFTAADTGGLPTSSGARLKAVPGYEGAVWLAGGADGLWVSSEFGYGSGLVQVADVEQADNVGFGKAAPSEAFPAVYVQAQVLGVRGIFRSDDAGASFLRINDAQHQYAAAQEAITGDPNVYGRVYLGTNGRGIVYGDCVDCGICGNGSCEPGENPCDCPDDCGAPPASELSCSDGGDDDCDGLVDCSDGDCTGSAACEVCGNGSCANGEDACSCASDCGPPPAEICTGGADEDCDGAVDCSDSDCNGDAACPSCSPLGASCTLDADCCGAGRCRGKAGAKTCK